MDYFKNLNRLEFVITYLCTSKCKHCFVGDDRKKKYPGFLASDLAVSIVEKLGSEYDLDSVMTFGGEPMLFPDITFAIHGAAKKAGIAKRQIITNGFWSNDFDKIKDLAEKAVDSGINSVSFSMDSFHNEYIPSEVVKKTAEELLRAGMKDIKWNPCWVSSQEDDNEYNKKTKELLTELDYLNIETSRGNIMDARGNALNEFKKYLPQKSINTKWKCGDEPYTDKPDDIQGICIEPNGEFDICPNFKGNCQEEDILNIIKKYNPYEDKITKIILEDGMNGLMEYAKENNIKIDEQGYYSVCDMCKKITKQIN